MDISIKDFDTDILKSKNLCIILGDTNSGKSTLIKDIINCTYNTIPDGIVCTDKPHHDFYSSFIKKQNIYKRYSTLIAKRCFIDGMFLILDNCFYNKEIYNEVINNCINKDILLLISLYKFTDFLNYDYIFICKFTNSNELNKIYKSYIEKFNEISLQYFIEIIILCTNNYEILVINCKTNEISELFLSYITENPNIKN